MKPKEQVNAMIVRLLNKRLGLPETGISGEKNWEQIDRQVDILKNNLGAKQIELMGKNQTDGYKVKLQEARDWLDGKISDEDLTL